MASSDSQASTHNFLEPQENSTRYPVGTLSSASQYHPFRAELHRNNKSQAVMQGGRSMSPSRLAYQVCSKGMHQHLASPLPQLGCSWSQAEAASSYQWVIFTFLDYVADDLHDSRCDCVDSNSVLRLLLCQTAGEGSDRTLGRSIVE